MSETTQVADVVRMRAEVIDRITEQVEELRLSLRWGESHTDLDSALTELSASAAQLMQDIEVFRTELQVISELSLDPLGSLLLFAQEILNAWSSAQRELLFNRGNQEDDRRHDEMYDRDKIRLGLLRRLLSRTPQGA